MKLLALAAVTLHGLASKVPISNQLLELDEGLNLRGHSSKKVQSPSLPTLDSDIYPVAPEDQLAAGVQAAGAQSPPGSALPRYHRKEEQAPNAFPETASKAPEVLRGQQLECHDSPHGWQDSNGNDCYQYKKGDWCSSSGSGAGWKDSWGSFVEWSNSMAGNGPQQACCACGGGVKLLASASQLDGRLQAPQDGFEGRGTAPADKLPEEFMESAPVTAPLDQIPAKFAHYLTSVDKKRQQPDVMGLSARFYSVKPTDDCNGPAPKSSSIDRALDYRFGFTGGFQRFLQLHAKHADAGSFFYGKWTGTINILEKGTYVFDLDLGFDSSSSIKIDGQELLTHGQCKASKEAYSCAQKRCMWLDGNCVPPSGAAPAPAPAPLAAVAAAPEWPRLVPERQSDVMSPWHNAAALGLLQAPSPAAPAAPAAPVPMTMAPVPAPMEAVPVAAPAAPAAPVPMAMAPVPAPMEAVPVPALAPAPPPFEAEGKPGEVLLSVGGHCVEVLVRADANSRSIQLSYNGPDTGHVKTVVPGQVLFCDPVVPACVSPELRSCKSSTCGSASDSAPAPAPAPAPDVDQVSLETEPRIPPGWSVPSMLEAVQR